MLWLRALYFPHSVWVLPTFSPLIPALDIFHVLEPCPILGRCIPWELYTDPAVGEAACNVHFGQWILCSVLALVQYAKSVVRRRVLLQVQVHGPFIGAYGKISEISAAGPEDTGISSQVYS